MRKLLSAVSRFIASVFHCSVLILMSPMIFVAYMMFTSPSVEKDPKKYASLLSKTLRGDLTAHFPNPLPPIATHINLSFYPGFLQGGSWFQVRLTLPEAEVSQIFETATQTAKEFYDGGDMFTLVNSRRGKRCGTSFRTAETNQKNNRYSGIEFPADYRIFIFDGKDVTFTVNGNVTVDGNHGWSKGIVVSRQRNEVIYYTESW